MKQISRWFISILLVLPLLTTNIYGTLQPPSIISESAILMDGDTGEILFEKNAHVAKAPASITKLMTALLTIENLEPSDTLTFSRNAVMSIESGSSHIGIREGETITVNDALHGLLLMSANEVANGLAEAIKGTTDAFALLMNQRAKELGAEHTNFTNPHGLYDEAHVTTAYDMALITKELLKSDYFLEIMSHTSYQIPPTNKADEIRYLHQTHKLLNPLRDPDLYREDTIAGKAGYTHLSGHTLVTVSQQGNRRLIAVSIKTDANHLYSDTNALLDYGFNAFSTYTMTPDDYKIPLPIKDDEGQAIGQAIVTLTTPIKFNLPEDTLESQLIYKNNLPEFLGRDIALDEKIGQLTIQDGAGEIGPWDLSIVDIELSPGIDVPSDGVNTTEGQSKPNTKVFTVIKITLSVLFLLVLAFFGLAYLDQKKRRSYRAYKKKRDAERKSTYTEY